MGDEWSRMNPQLILRQMNETTSFYFYYLKQLGFFAIKKFNWRLITLQYCGGFCIHSHESAMGVHMVPSLTHPPIPQGHPEHPVSSIEPGLAIYFTYDNIHVSMLYSQIIPPSPSPTE